MPLYSDSTSFQDIMHGQWGLYIISRHDGVSLMSNQIDRGIHRLQFLNVASPLVWLLCFLLADTAFNFSICNYNAHNLFDG
jgi:hypothetical protein